MFALALTLTALAAPLQFEFVGQPDCVALRYADGLTTLTNGCDGPLLIDQSVRLPHQHQGLIPAHTEVQIRDLSAFTLGWQGRLYRVRAQIVEPDAPAPNRGDPADTGVTD